MIKQIEITPLLNEDLDFTLLFKELDQFFVEYKNMVNKQILFNKKKTRKIDNYRSSEYTEVADTTLITESAEEPSDDSADEMNKHELAPEPDRN